MLYFYSAKPYFKVIEKIFKRIVVHLMKQLYKFLNTLKPMEKTLNFVFSSLNISDQLLSES